MKKILKSFLFIAIILLGSFILSACNENQPEEPEAQEAQIVFNGFEKVDENTYKISIANSKQYLNINEMVQVSGEISWTLHTDITATETIPSKVASPLVVGDNTFYVCVTSNNNIKLYTLQIRRRPIYIVSFNSMNDETIENQNIEENSKVQKPQDPFKLGYIFIGWNYNFDTPITSDLTITANYTTNEYKLTYKMNDDSNNNTINEIFTIEDLEYNLMKPTRENYTFIGWHLDENLLDDCLSTINSIGDKTVFAEWEYGTEGLQYELTSYGWYDVTGYIGDSQSVVIPNTHLGIDVKRVTTLYNSVTNENIITELYISSNIYYISYYAIKSVKDKIESITIEAVNDNWERSYMHGNTIFSHIMRYEVDITDAEETAIYMVRNANYVEHSNFTNLSKYPK